MLGWSSIQRRGKWVSRRFVYSLLTNCSRMSVRRDILWSANKLARAVTKWTEACDKRLARLISYIHHTSEYRQSCHVGNTAQQCRLALFQDSDFAGYLEDSKSTSGGVLCIFGSHTFANKLDVQETDFSFTQLYRSLNHFSRCRFTHGRYSRSHSLRLGDWSISFRTEQDWTTQRRASGNPVAGYQAKHAQPQPIQAHQRHSNKHWSHSIKYNDLWVLVPCCKTLRTMRR